jgi:hypothetical protein
MRSPILVFLNVFAHWLFDSLSLHLKLDIPKLMDRLRLEITRFWDLTPQKALCGQIEE